MAKIVNVGVQMDHVSGINIAGDSTFAMSLEAQSRGYRLFHYTPEKLSLRDGNGLGIDLWISRWNLCLDHHHHIRATRSALPSIETGCDIGTCRI